MVTLFLLEYFQEQRHFETSGELSGLRVYNYYFIIKASQTRQNKLPWSFAILALWT